MQQFSDYSAKKTWDRKGEKKAARRQAPGCYHQIGS
jgi:hypothetical protein